LRPVFAISLADLRPLRTEIRCGIPVAIGRAAQPPILPCTGRGLSCRRHCWRRGGLLPHLFTLTSRLPARRFVFCDTFRRRALKRAARTCREARAASCPAVSGLSSPSINNRRQFNPPACDQRTWSDEPAPKPSCQPTAGPTRAQALPQNLKLDPTRRYARTGRRWGVALRRHPCLAPPTRPRRTP
jgi:hypothetical protein